MLLYRLLFLVGLSLALKLKAYVGAPDEQREDDREEDEEEEDDDFEDDDYDDDDDDIGEYGAYNKYLDLRCIDDEGNWLPNIVDVSADARAFLRDRMREKYRILDSTAQKLGMLVGGYFYSQELSTEADNTGNGDDDDRASEAPTKEKRMDIFIQNYTPACRPSAKNADGVIAFEVPTDTDITASIFMVWSAFSEHLELVKNGILAYPQEDFLGDNYPEIYVDGLQYMIDMLLNNFGFRYFTVKESHVMRTLLSPAMQQLIRNAKIILDKQKPLMKFQTSDAMDIGFYVESQRVFISGYAQFNQEITVLNNDPLDFAYMLQNTNDAGEWIIEDDGDVDEVADKRDAFLGFISEHYTIGIDQFTKVLFTKAILAYDKELESAEDMHKIVQKYIPSTRNAMKSKDTKLYTSINRNENDEAWIVVDMVAQAIVASTHLSRWTEALQKFSVAQILLFAMRSIFNGTCGWRYLTVNEAKSSEMMGLVFPLLDEIRKALKAGDFQPDTGNEFGTIDLTKYSTIKFEPNVAESEAEATAEEPNVQIFTYRGGFLAGNLITYKGVYNKELNKSAWFFSLKDKGYFRVKDIFAADLAVRLGIKDKISSKEKELLQIEGLYTSDEMKNAVFSDLVGENYNPVIGGIGGDTKTSYRIDGEANFSFRYYRKSVSKCNLSSKELMLIGPMRREKSTINIDINYRSNEAKELVDILKTVSSRPIEDSEIQGKDRKELLKLIQERLRSGIEEKEDKWDKCSLAQLKIRIGYNMSSTEVGQAIAPDGYTVLEFKYAAPLYFFLIIANEDYNKVKDGGIENLREDGYSAFLLRGEGNNPDVLQFITTGDIREGWKAHCTVENKSQAKVDMERSPNFKIIGKGFSDELVRRDKLSGPGRTQTDYDLLAMIAEDQYFYLYYSLPWFQDMAAFNNEAVDFEKLDLEHPENVFDSETE